MSFEPSNYQKSILNYIDSSNGNLLVDAKAGSGKTSTLCLIADKIIAQDKKCLFLAFNKSIVEELQSRIISDNVQIKTLHSLGLTFLRSYLYKKHGENYVIDVDQHDDRIKDWVQDSFARNCDTEFRIANSELSDPDFKDLLGDVLREISQMVNYSRLYNANYHDYEQIYKLAPRLCWNLKNWDDIGLKDFPKVIEEVIDKIKYEFENPELDSFGKPIYKVGYTDMIYFPCLYRMNIPWATRQYLDFVLVDETQDLSVLQQMFLKLLINFNTRLIAVGDEKQSIYAFAGADTKSIQNLKKNFALNELPLNICYRCPENVIKVAQDIVPEIDWNHKRYDKGEVKFLDEIDLAINIKANDVILARRNNDLVRLYKKLVLDDKISVKFKNTEMVTTIVNEIKRVIKEYIKRYNQCLNVEKELYRLCEEANIDWKQSDEKMSKSDREYMQNTFKRLVKNAKTLKKPISKSNYTVDYLLDCMKEYKEEGDYSFVYDGMQDNVLAEYYDVVESLINNYKENCASILVKDLEVYIDSFLKGNINKEAPILSSIHMMKGGEADNVYIYDYPRFPYVYSSQTEDAQQQEKNLQYVALTRPKKNLYLLRISRCRNRETVDDINTLNVASETNIRLLLNRSSN